MNVLTSYRMSMNFGVLDYVFLLFYSLLYVITELRPVLWFHLHHEKLEKPHKKQVIPIKKKTIDDVPGPRPRIPILGTRWIFSSLFGKYKLEKIHEAYADLFAKHGPIIREEAMWNFPVISLYEREAIEKVYRTPCKTPMRPPTEIAVMYRRSKPDRYHGIGLINEQGEAWVRLKNILTPDLRSTQTIHRFGQELQNICDDFRRLLRQDRDETGSLLNFEEMAKRIGLESTCMLILGHRMGFLENEKDARCEELSIAVKGLFSAKRETYYGLPLWKMFPSQTYSLYAKSEEKIYDIVSSFVDQALGKEGDVCSDDAAVQSIFLSVLHTPGLDIREKKSAMIDFIASGIHTLGNTLVFILYLMAKHQEVQERLYQEIIELAPGNEPVTTEVMQHAKYLKACFTETQRLLPTAPMVARILQTDMELSGYNFKSGTVVLMHSWLACLNEENFTDAKMFRPERWLPEFKDTMKSAPYVMAPFGVGKRICPGKRFAEQALMMLLATLVKEFHIEYDGELELIFEFVLTPKSPVSFRFKDRV